MVIVVDTIANHQFIHTATSVTHTSSGDATNLHTGSRQRRGAEEQKNSIHRTENSQSDNDFLFYYLAMSINIHFCVRLSVCLAVFSPANSFSNCDFSIFFSVFGCDEQSDGIQLQWYRTIRSMRASDLNSETFWMRRKVNETRVVLSGYNFFFQPNRWNVENAIQCQRTTEREKAEKKTFWINRLLSTWNSTNECTLVYKYICIARRGHPTGP